MAGEPPQGSIISLSTLWVYCGNATNNGQSLMTIDDIKPLQATRMALQVCMAALKVSLSRMA